MSSGILYSNIGQNIPVAVLKPTFPAWKIVDRFGWAGLLVDVDIAK